MLRPLGAALVLVAAMAGRSRACETKSDDCQDGHHQVRAPVAIAAEASPSGAITEVGSNWTDESGKTLSFAEFKGRKLVLTFAYTSCLTGCPMVMRQLKRIDDQLKARGETRDFIFVTLDPRLDTSEKLKLYKDKWKVAEARWHFLRSTDEVTRKLADAVGFKYRIIDEHIWHDKKVLLIGEDGRVERVLEGIKANLEEKE